MADDDPRLLREDGYLNVDIECKTIIYHDYLNVLLITSTNGQVYVFDVNSGTMLQKSSLSGKSNGKLQGVYVAEGIEKVLCTDGTGIGIRSDYNGVLLLDTILQTPVSKGEDIVKLELLLPEALLLLQSLRWIDLPGIDQTQEVIQELSSKILSAQANQRKGVKAQRWNTICLELPHGSLKLVCSGLVLELKKHNQHIPALTIASAINERLNGLLPGLTLEGSADRSLMFSESDRHDTFSKWPHMNHKWALPDQMARAGFYHQPKSSGDDRAMCFTCNVCLVSWEPTDEPWSEHERHSPACPYVKGEYTQNVPLSVTLATAPAHESGDMVDVIGTTNLNGLVATGSNNGLINIWNITNKLKREISFYMVPSDREVNNKNSIQFSAAKNLTLYLSSFKSDLDPLPTYKPANGHKLQLTALSIVSNPKFQSEMQQAEVEDTQARPCLVCGVTVMVSNPLQMRTLENVWATSSDLASSSSLVRAMNNVNSAASDTLDIMKVASDRYPTSRLHYLVLYDFDYKTKPMQTNKEENTKDLENKKTLSGTGTSASSNGERQDSFYQELFMGKLFYQVPVIEDVESDMLAGGCGFDGMFSTAALTASSSNGIYATPNNITAPLIHPNPLDINFNPINSSEQFASTSDLIGVNKNTLELLKTSKTEPSVVQTLSIEAPNSLRITHITPSKDGRHLYVAFSPNLNNTFNEFPSCSNTNKMDVDEESEFFSQKSYMHWDPMVFGSHNESQSPKHINGEIHNETKNNNVLLFVYALDFSGKVVQLIPEPVVRRELPLEQAPIEHVLLPLREEHKSKRNNQEPSGQVALVCKDGIIRLLDLCTLKTVTEARLDGKKFVSASYCNSLGRLCACTADGALHFFVISKDEDSAEEKEETDDMSMITDSNNTNTDNVSPSTSTSNDFQDPIIAHRSNLNYTDLRTLYELTRFDRQSLAYGATVPPCWSEMMRAQRQCRYPQHLHQSKDHTWRLQSDATAWDEHIFELTLPRSASGNIGHVDVRFSLHSFCQELLTIQVTLLKQNIKIGHNGRATSVDEKIDFSIGNESNAENPVVTEEYQRQHNREILCGPIDLNRCLNLSGRSGCVTLTSPKLFRSKARTLLVHIKALNDPTKDAALGKSKTNLGDTKPPTSKKLRIAEVHPAPGSIIERFAEGANSKKIETYIGCDWIHEISITVRPVQPTTVPNERLQRCAMLESKICFDNLLNVACLQTSNKSPVVQSLALDILIWLASIRLTRLRGHHYKTDMKILQLETIRSVQNQLPNLLRTCLLRAGRSVAHKCMKLITLCSCGFYNLEDPPLNSFDEAVLVVLESLLPSIIEVQWAGSLRWLQLLITKFLPLDRSHGIAQQCINLIQQISTEMSNRANPYHLLLATRFGLYNSPFETELFDLEPPIPPKFSSTPVTYATVVNNEQTGTPLTTSSSVYSQDTIDLRDLLTLPTHPANELVVPSKLKALCSNHNMKGLLEVEPLHFTCFAASDGTKIEKIDSGVGIVNTGTTNLFENATTNNGVPEIKSVHPNYNLDTGSVLDVQTKSTSILNNFLSLRSGQILKKPSTQLLFTPDEQSDCDDTHDQIWLNSQKTNPHTFNSILNKDKSPVKRIDSSINKIEDNHPKKREDVTFPWGRLLSWPSQQALVVDRMHSGARRFVILDFGAPVLLTDLMIPSCIDLVSLSIDIWTKSEETDGTRLIVASDISTKPLAICDLQPPPVCRYLKITTIGRYGMSPTKCKIPLGMFYGHMVVLPGEDYAESNNDSSSILNNIFDPFLQTTIESQCNILSALAEDVQCRFSLATERLKSLLDPLLNSETPNVVHMQHYLCYNKASNESTEQPPKKILSTYQECIVFQHQLNIVHGVWRRLESWRNSQDLPVTGLTDAPNDKLRILGETLLDILLYIVYEIGPVPSIPVSLCYVFTPSISEKFFHSICVSTPAPRLQLHAVTFLARMAGHQPWWGNFLSNTLINLFSSNSTCIFPQDRVFILLTFLGRKSLIAGSHKSSVIDAMVRTLRKLLSPLLHTTSKTNQSLDTTLIGWVLLFLSVCLDTAAVSPTCVEDNHDKNKEQGVATRWEFIQGESAMQRKYANASKSSTSRSYRKKLQKRLMHHKQQLYELEQAKKAFHASSQAWATLSSQAATLYNKVEATMKSQERMFKKTIKQHSAKHFKDIFSIRRNEVQHSSRNSRIPSQSNIRSDVMDLDVDSIASLSYHSVLPVAKGLVSLILNSASNVDMFLLSCKVVARLVISTRPAISLNELMSEEQLLKLVRLAIGSTDAAWASHAVSCLLQDVLEGGRLYPKVCTTQEESPSEESFESLTNVESRTVDDDSPVVASTSNSTTIMARADKFSPHSGVYLSAMILDNDEDFAEGDADEDTQDSIVITSSTTPSTSKSNGFLPSLWESDSEIEDFLDDIIERGRSMLKKGSNVSKILISGNSGSISMAMDARLEHGIEAGVEIALRMLPTLGMYNLPHSINATINVPTEMNRDQASKTDSGWNEKNQELWNSYDLTQSLSMLTRCFDKIFTELYLKNTKTSLELVLQLWLTLNLDAASEQSNITLQFHPSFVPVIPLSSASISSLISTLSWHPGVSLRAWCLALQCLTVASNQSSQSDQMDSASTAQPLEVSLGGMAECIVRERSIGPMLLRLLSGSGLNVDTFDKYYVMAGPTVCQALQDFLVRLELRCDVITPSSPLGNILKELLLWVVHQLIQPGGALLSRRGPLDAQCKFISSLMNLDFNNTDSSTCLSISECVGVLVSTYIRGSGVGAQIVGSTVDSIRQSGSFGGLFARVLGGDTRQGRPVSWDTLIVTLIKLVCKLIQTPLKNTIESDVMDLSDTTAGSSQMDDESKAKESRIPCVADTVLQHDPTMMRLLGALGQSTGSSLAMTTMLFGEGTGIGTASELTDPTSIPDATFQLLTTLTKQTSDPALVLTPLYRYLALSCEEAELDHHVGAMQLSEPLIWYILRVLDNVSFLSAFTSMGGVRVICQNLVKSSANSSNNSNCSGVIALVMEHLSNAPSLTPINTTTSTSKKIINSLESNKDGLLNFAPLGNISLLNSTAPPADALIQNATPHKRTRVPAWSYHFYPDEAWVDLTITLPCAILLRRVELEPHLSSLATCPSAVAIEISKESNGTLTPVCSPMLTSGLTFIRLTLSQPEVTTAVLIRLYKPRDSTHISLSQIKLLGTTAFGEIKTTHDVIDEEQLTKTSLGWLRLLHQCLSVSTLNSSVVTDVLNSAASVDGLVEACCNLLLLPTPSVFTPNLEIVLLLLGLHSKKLGVRLINLLLDNTSTFFLQGSSSNQETSTVRLVVELLQQLCSFQDSNTIVRMTLVLHWLKKWATSCSNSVCPPAVYVHCISAIIWEAHRLENLNYDLESMLKDDIFNALYDWTLTLEPSSALKQSIDSVLCAICYVRPSLFTSLLQKVNILVPKLATDNSASISDDSKAHETGDSKCDTPRFVLSGYKELRLTEGQLLTVAATARSPIGVQQLIDSGLPALLVASIADFCTFEKTKQENIIKSNEEVVQDKTDQVEETGLERNDQLEPASIAMILEFLTLVCSEGNMRDWLGKEGRGFWLPLLSFLSSRPIRTSSLSSLRCSKTSISYGTLENAMIKFLSRCCWCHLENQKLLAQILTEVISQQRTNSNVRYLHGISGFTRRLILQLLLEGEKVLISVRSEAPIKISHQIANQNIPVFPAHPAHPLGHYHQLLYMSTQSTVADILQQESGTWLNLLLPNNYQGNESNNTPINRTRELWESGIALVVDTLSVAAGNTAKDKRAKEASNRSQARGPIIRKCRSNSEGTSVANKNDPNSTSTSSSNCTHTHYLIHSSRPNTPLPPQLTIAQLLALTEDSGISLSEPCLHLILRQRSKNSKVEEILKQVDSDLLNYRSIESSLSIFSASGGLAVLARHLPLVNAESGRSPPFIEKSPSPEQSDADWVKVDATEDIYENMEESSGTNTDSSKIVLPAPYVPHSLAAFGLFLMLPGYAEVLLRDRKPAHCLLRLALGISDDGEGGDVFTLPFAASLSTLPFQVLKQLLDATPLTTDNGLYLRKTTIEVGAMVLLFNCLAIFTHQSGQNDGSEQKSTGGGRNDENAHLYWAKGTGYGTGSTQQSWNVEQALLRQRSEEEHVTVLLEVLASYIGSSGQSIKELPPTFVNLLSRSCLIPALASYLRNDSVLDMARHIPLYKAILQLLRAMALSSQLIPLLSPRLGKSGDPSLVSLLSNMKVCVGTYVHKISRTRTNVSKSISKYPEDTEQDEGLALLISDIQESATVVQNATSRLANTLDESSGQTPTGPELPLLSVEQRYLEVMKKLQFEAYEMITENPDGGGYKFAVSYRFESNMKAAGDRSHPTRVKRLAQEAVTLSTALPLSYSSSVFVRCDADRLDVMKVLITGPPETPYANGCFEFDVYFPPDYPNSPMMINLETTGRHSVRFNPNLYNDGRVCLSVLNTWHGRPEEKWNSHTSSFLQVLVSIQSLILVSEPYFNEPGYERQRGTSNAAQSSQEYNANICQATARWAMLEQIRNPCPCFKEVIHTHFWIKRHEIVAQLEGWIRDMESQAADRRAGRTISIHVLALRRHYRLLREELNKLPTPEGLEDLIEPLASPGSPIELSGTSVTPSTPPMANPVPTTTVNSSINNSGDTSGNSNHEHHDIDTDVEMEKMVSKVCE